MTLDPASAIADLRRGNKGSRRVKAALAAAGISLSRRRIQLVPAELLIEALKAAQKRKAMG